MHLVYLLKPDSSGTSPRMTNAEEFRARKILVLHSSEARSAEARPTGRRTKCAPAERSRQAACVSGIKQNPTNMQPSPAASGLAHAMRMMKILSSIPFPEKYLHDSWQTGISRRLQAGFTHSGGADIVFLHYRCHQRAEGPVGVRGHVDECYSICRRRPVAGAGGLV